MLSTKTDRYALSHDAGLLHPAWSTKLLHVLAEVALAALGPHTRLTAPAPCPPPPRASQRLTARHPLCIQLKHTDAAVRSGDKLLPVNGPECQACLDINPFHVLDACTSNTDGLLELLRLEHIYFHS